MAPTAFQPFSSLALPSPRLAPAATVYGKNADSWAADNINSSNSQNQQYAQQLQNKDGYRTCESRCLWIGP